MLQGGGVGEWPASRFGSETAGTDAAPRQLMWRASRFTAAGEAQQQHSSSTATVTEPKTVNPGEPPLERRVSSFGLQWVRAGCGCGMPLDSQQQHQSSPSGVNVVLTCHWEEEIALVVCEYDLDPGLLLKKTNETEGRVQLQGEELTLGYPNPATQYS